MRLDDGCSGKADNSLRRKLVDMRMNKKLCAMNVCFQMPKSFCNDANFVLFESSLFFATLAT